MRNTLTRAAVVAVIGAVLCSCSAKIDGVLQSGGAGSFTVSVTFSPKMEELVASLSKNKNKGNASSNKTALDAASISESLKQAPGIASVDLKNSGSRTIQGVVKINDVGSLLSAPLEGGGYIRLVQYEESSTSGRITFSLDRDSGSKVLAFLSEDISDYLTTLFAPIASGEKMSDEEYLAEVNKWYPGGLADEIKSAKINVRVKFPGKINRIKGGEFQGDEAVFDVSLLDILVLEKPFVWEVQWTPE
jgi:hypothetical protein